MKCLYCGCTKYIDYHNIVIIILTMCNLTLIEYVSHFAKKQTNKPFQLRLDYCACVFRVHALTVCSKNTPV